jgi:hypothetical protein
VLSHAGTRGANPVVDAVGTLAGMEEAPAEPGACGEARSYMLRGDGALAPEPMAGVFWAPCVASCYWLWLEFR